MGRTCRWAGEIELVPIGVELNGYDAYGLQSGRGLDTERHTKKRKDNNRRDAATAWGTAAHGQHAVASKGEHVRWP